MKYGLIVAALLATPIMAFAAVKLSGIDIIKTYDVNGQHLTKYQDYDNGATCYTVQSTSGNSLGQISISCIK